MSGLDWLLEIVLLGMLAFTLLHAIRLERALAGLRRDRAALGEAVTGVTASARHAEQGMSTLHQLAHAAAEQVGRKIEAAATVRDDLAYLADRGEALADRLEGLVRSGRTYDRAGGEAPASVLTGEGAPKLRSQSERQLLQALRGTR